MGDLLFDTSHSFRAFTHLHGIPLALSAVLMSGVIVYARSCLSSRRQVALGFALSCLPPLCVVFRMVCTSLDGTFSIEEELPFHLCRTLALIFPFVMYHQSRKWFGITYFFTVVGTLQALLTPDLPLSAPHYSYWSYWVLHGVLFYLPFYCIFVFGWRVTRRDLLHAIIAGNVYLLGTGVINYFLGANYFYTSHKPPSPSLLDVLGPWPWYIVVVELVSIVLFVLAWLPFGLGNRNSTSAV